jgi:hypothetical protein
MDEIFGYLPPTAVPPSKGPLLRMLKQARAFGLGLLLATQNPVDVDYKALSNAGTWFIGKLQTEQDKQRLLDGLESAASGTLDRGTLDRLISGLGKRVFIMNNVHEKQPVLFQTRWTMNFLAGPMTRAQIPALNKLVGASFQPSAPSDQPSAVSSEPATPALESVPVPEGFEPIPVPVVVPAATTPPSPINRQSSVGNLQASLTRPSVPAGISEFFLPLNMSFAKAAAALDESLPPGSAPGGVVYHPTIVASAQVRFLDRKYNLDTETVKSALVANPEKRGVVRWDDFATAVPDAREMDPAPNPQARFAALDVPFSDARMMASLQKDFADWVYRTSKISVRANNALGLYATPDVSQAEFMKACAEAAREARDAAVTKATASIDRQIKTLKDKMAREERELKMDESELSQRKGEELATHAENILGVFGRSRSTRRLSSSLTKRRLTEQAKEDVQESIDVLGQYDKELQQLEEARQQALEEAGGQWGEVVNQITEVPVLPKKTDIYVDLFGVAWMPYYQVDSGGQILEIQAFG